MILFGPFNEVLDHPALDIPVTHFGGDLSTTLKDVLRCGDVFIDVGAKNGVSSTLLASQLVGEAGRVLALEPNPSKFARLLHNVSLNRAHNTMCFPVAASDETIQATLFCEFPHRPVASPAKNIRVQRIDTLCAKLGCESVRLVKIDAPGSELLVLRGMTRLLGGQAAPPAVLCHASRWMPQALNEGRDRLINFMADFGYTPRQLGPTEITRAPGTQPQVRFTLWFTKSGASPALPL